MRQVRQLLFGITTFIPGVSNLDPRGTGGTGSARYCYTVWLRHLVLAREKGLLVPFPRTVAELGPGDSIGIGLAALICGAERYYGLDAVRYSSLKGNVAIFDDLVMLFGSRADIPGEAEFPHVRPVLPSYGFPSEILSESHLAECLEEGRLKRIRDSINGVNRLDSMIRYHAPWTDAHVIERESVDLIFSQAVLEHIDGLEQAYRAMSEWLKPGAFLSHEIDYKCHGYATEWNGHWTYSDLRWALIRGGRKYLLNRRPHSEQMALLRNAGFQVIREDRGIATTRVTRRDLAPRFRTMGDEDLVTCDAFIQARKPEPPASRVQESRT